MLRTATPLLALLALAAPRPALAEPPAPGRTWTLPELLGLADRAHPEVRDAELRAEQAKADAVTAGLLPNPQLQVGVSNVPTSRPSGSSWGDVLVYGAGLSEELELGGKRARRVESAGAGVEAGAAAARDARRAGAADVAAAFYRALAAQEQQRLAEEALGHYRETVRLSRARVAAGDIAGADLNKIELETLRYESEVRARALAAVQARAELFRLLALPADPGADRVEGPFRGPLAGPDPARIEAALAARADLQALEAAQRKARADLALAHAKAVPDVTLALGYAYSPSEVPSGAVSTLGLSATVPLPVFDRNQGEVQKAELEVQRADLALERARGDARREVTLALDRLARAEAALASLESEYLAKATQARDLAERTYLEGHTTLLEELEAQRTYLETRSAHLDTQLERSLGAVDLERALGQRLP